MSKSAPVAGGIRISYLRVLLAGTAGREEGRSRAVGAATRDLLLLSYQGDQL